MKRLLVIASDFPPLVGTNTQRVQSFVRHLPSFGWTSRVVTQAIADLPQIDSRELRRIPSDVRVTRVPNPDPFAARARQRGRGPADVTPDPSGSAEDRERTAPAIDASEGRSQPLVSSWAREVGEVGSRVLKAVLREFFYVPDPLRLWAEKVGRECAVGETEGIQAILSSSPAYSCHLAGRALKRRIGVPWVADFRDLWVGRPFRQVAGYVQARRDQRLEAKVVAECDRVLLASPAWIDTFQRRYGKSIEHKLAVITNGYDAEVLEQARLRMPRRLPGRTGMRFLLTGSMHEGESPVPFIQALGAIKAVDPQLVADVQVDLVGNSAGHLERIAQEINCNGLAEHFRLRGPTSNAECVAMQLEADCLLLFSSVEHADTIRGKSFEYMATGRRIFACIPTNGIQAEMLRQAGTAIIVKHGDVTATTNALREVLIGDGKQCEPIWSYIQAFERRALTMKLAAILDEVSA